MFRFIHTSDWHLGQNFYGYDRGEEQSDFLRQLADIVHEQQPDALLVSGDIYHTAAPSSAAVGMYVKGMLDIHEACPTMAIIVRQPRQCLTAPEREPAVAGRRCDRAGRHRP